MSEDKLAIILKKNNAGWVLDCKSQNMIVIALEQARAEVERIKWQYHSLLRENKAKDKYAEKTEACIRELEAQLQKEKP